MKQKVIVSFDREAVIAELVRARNKNQKLIDNPKSLFKDNYRGRVLAYNHALKLLGYHVWGAEQ